MSTSSSRSTRCSMASCCRCECSRVSASSASSRSFSLKYLMTKTIATGNPNTASTLTMGMNDWIISEFTAPVNVPDPVPFRAPANEGPPRWSPAALRPVPPKKGSRFGTGRRRGGKRLQSQPYSGCAAPFRARALWVYLGGGNLVGGSAKVSALVCPGQERKQPGAFLRIGGERESGLRRQQIEVRAQGPLRLHERLRLVGQRCARPGDLLQVLRQIAHGLQVLRDQTRVGSHLRMRLRGLEDQPQGAEHVLRLAGGERLADPERVRSAPVVGAAGDPLHGFARRLRGAGGVGKELRLLGRAAARGDRGRAQRLRTFRCAAICRWRFRPRQGEASPRILATSGPCGPPCCSAATAARKGPRSG